MEVRQQIPFNQLTISLSIDPKTEKKLQEENLN